MAFMTTPDNQVDNQFHASFRGVQRASLISCIDGTDGYPKLSDFNAHMERYLNGKKRPERTVISTADLEHVYKMLSDPAALRADPSASHRTWIKKTFFLKSTPSGTLVCHREKGQPIGRPIASKEAMYYILKEAHASEGHGGRDKTAKAVKLTHSFVRKGLICLFLDTCPTCQVRNEAVKKEKLSSPYTRQNSIYGELPNSATSFGTAFTSPESPALDLGLGWDHAPTTTFTHRGSLPISLPRANLMIKSPTMPPELAFVPAAPMNPTRGGFGTYLGRSPSQLNHRASNPEISTGIHLDAPLSSSTFYQIEASNASSYTEANIPERQENPILDFISSISQEASYPQSLVFELSQSQVGLWPPPRLEELLSPGTTLPPQFLAGAPDSGFQESEPLDSKNSTTDFDKPTSMFSPQPHLPPRATFQETFQLQDPGFRQSNLSMVTDHSPNSFSMGIYPQFQEILSSSAQMPFPLAPPNLRRSCY